MQVYIPNVGIGVSGSRRRRKDGLLDVVVGSGMEDLSQCVCSVTRPLRTDIQSSSVEPIPEPELMARFEGKNVQEQVVRFFRINNVRRFMLKRPFHRGQKDKTNEYKSLHVDRIVYSTTHRFPNILRWFEVKSTDTVRVVGRQST